MKSLKSVIRHCTPSVSLSPYFSPFDISRKDTAARAREEEKGCNGKPLTSPTTLTARLPTTGAVGDTRRFGP